MVAWGADLRNGGSGLWRRTWRSRAEDGVDEAEEGRPDAVGEEANDNNQRGKPGRQATAAVREPHPGAFKPGMGKREPFRRLKPLCHHPGGESFSQADEFIGWIRL